MTRVSILCLALACSGGGDDDDSPEPTDTGSTDVDTRVARLLEAFGDADAGEALYGTQCAVCHGEGGVGGSAPALLDSGLLVEDVYVAMLEPPGAMPSFAQRTDAELRDLATYLDQRVLAVNLCRMAATDTGTYTGC